MLKRVEYFYIKFKFLSIILILLLFHFSILIFITNIDAKEFTNSKTLFNHSCRQTNNTVINKIDRRKRKLLKINIAQKNNLILNVNISTLTVNFKFIKFSELTFLKFDEFINTYIEFRPPPALLS